MKNSDTKKQSKKQGRIKHPIRTPQQWDDLCQKAVPLQEKGMAYPEIAKHLSCHVTNLRQELKKKRVVERVQCGSVKNAQS